MEKKECLVYNLNFIPGISGYLPNIYISEVDDNGRLYYMMAKAVPENIHSFDLDFKGTIHEELFQLCQELTIDFLEEKFSKKGRKKFLINQLYEDDKIKNVIKQYLSRKMGRFLQIVFANKLPLCLEIERKVLLEDIRVYHSGQSLEPILSFRKTQTGINYSLMLKAEEELLNCKNHDFHLVLDEPAFVIKDYVLYELQNINANKLKPFLNKDSIFIPSHLTKTYFDKFIMDLVSKVDIDAEGFEIVKHDKIVSVSTRVTTDFIADELLLELIIDYGRTSFNYSEVAFRRSSLSMDDLGNITIHQVERHPDEKTYVDLLLQCGLQSNLTKRFKLPEKQEKFDLIYWLARNKGSLQSKGVNVNEPILDGKPIVLSIPAIKMNMTSDNDWFDIKGTILIGDKEIAFEKIIENIRSGDPYYRLSDGSYFIIPQAWMTKYSALAKFGQKQQGKFKIRKSNYMVVEELEEISPLVMEEVTTTIQDIHYSPSPYLKATLRPYQTDGVKWLLKHQINEMGACLADDMGLGKTLQTLAVLNHTKDHLKPKKILEDSPGQLTLFGQERKSELNPLNALIILPASLIFNWYAEIRKFSPRFHTVQYVGSKRKDKGRELDKFDVVLTTYQTALRDIKILSQIEWSYVVLDESQMIKNKESKIFQAVNTLNTKNKVSLSGTPIENSLSDLWSQMQFINPGMLGSFSFFKENYLLPIERQADEAALDHLKSLVQPFILRRRKEEVAKELPPLTEQIEYVYMAKEQTQIYESEKSAVRNQLLNMDEKDPSFRFQVFKSLMLLRQIANHPVLADNDFVGESGKFNDVLDKLSTIIKSGHKALIFSSFTSHLALFQKYFENHKISYAQLTGSSTQNQRKENVAKFQTKEDCKIFLISIKAGGTGLNLTEAAYVFILDPWWNPFVEDQAIARAHRIGQDKPVSVIKFISKDSIEEKIIRMQARKKILSAEIIEKPEQLHLTKSDLKDLLS